MTYLRVKNHDKYQHYKDRNPPWIKLYRSILADYDLRQIPIPSRLCFIYCTLLACETDNRIPHDLKYLSERMGLTVTEAMLTPLLERGLLLALGARRVLAHDATCSSLSLSSPNLPPDQIQIPDLRSNGHAIKKVAKEFPGEMIYDDSVKSHWADHGIDPAIEFAKFRDYHLARATKFIDWKAAWRNWARNAIKYQEDRHVRSLR